ncbi:helix-turn-helix domain-containing protein [Saxibacter everestensis]|uniref:Helix-turn-helix domain-containing protein n=1 Tax=Saxibacter everestensis TaxID=2909229 RepID=A0ABY8QT74_9MICO|nr:helix-turn-helix domain-containing protein [Brevibacteriaceae bacterium ZFBP1038]
MAVRRTYGSYNDGCASAHALDLIGERWALIIVRELLLGPKRFLDIQRDIPGIGPAALSQRLHNLEEAGIAVRRKLPMPTHVTMYDLTDWGRDLEAVNSALSLWAVRSPRLPLDADMSPDTVVLAMRAHARPLAHGARSRRISLKLTDSRVADREPVEYLATLATEGTFITKMFGSDDVDALVTSTTRAWKSLIISGDRSPLESCEDITVEGDREAVRVLLDATQLQAPVQAGSPFGN